MTGKIYKQWRIWCTKLDQASGAFDANRDGPHRLDYLRAWRYAERKCVQLERQM